MKDSTIKTIRFALRLLQDLNYSIAFQTTSDTRFQTAKRDLEKDDDAIIDFEEFLRSKGF